MSHATCYFMQHGPLCKIEIESEILPFGAWSVPSHPLPVIAALPLIRNVPALKHDRNPKQSSHRERHDSLLSVQSILGLVIHTAVRPVDDGIGHLDSPVCR